MCSRFPCNVLELLLMCHLHSTEETVYSQACTTVCRLEESSGLHPLVGKRNGR